MASSESFSSIDNIEKSRIVSPLIDYLEMTMTAKPRETAAQKREREAAKRAAEEKAFREVVLFKLFELMELAAREDVEFKVVTFSDVVETKDVIYKDGEVVVVFHPNDQDYERFELSSVRSEEWEFDQTRESFNNKRIAREEQQRQAGVLREANAKLDAAFAALTPEEQKLVKASRLQ